MDLSDLVNGAFEFKGEVEYTGHGHDDADRPTRHRAEPPAVLPGQRRDQHLASADLLSKAVITGSPLNMEFAKYKPFISGYDSGRWFPLNRIYGGSSEVQRNDTTFMKWLDGRFRQAIDLRRAWREFIQTNPKPFFSIVAMKELSVANNMNLEELEPMFVALDKEVRETREGKNFPCDDETWERQLVDRRPCPDFTQNDVNGKPAKLSDFKGKYVPLDFWASWCAALPRGKSATWWLLHKAYKAKNFRVLSVSLGPAGEKRPCSWPLATKRRAGNRSPMCRSQILGQ